MLQKSAVRILLLIITLFSIGVVLLQRWPLNDHYVFSFLYLLIPFFWLYNILLILIFLKKRDRFILIPLAFIVVSIPQIKETFALNLSQANSENAFKIVSYNAGAFNYKRFHSIMDTVSSKKSIKWLAKNIQSDILCVQEFYNDDAIDAEQALEQIEDNPNYEYFYTNPIKIGKHNGYFGLITFSKFPIVNAGPLIFGDEGLNRGVYTDLKIADDTIRVINVHLKSMSIRIDSSTSITSPTTILANATAIKDKLKIGFENRSKEIDSILHFVSHSPYKVILCGDFNETPYSYVYRKLKSKLNNAFEEAGFGFGFTYNKFPYFIRIDNHFHDPKIKALHFSVHDNNRNSDHMPIEAHYTIH